MFVPLWNTRRAMLLTSAAYSPVVFAWLNAPIRLFGYGIYPFGHEPVP